MLTIRQFASIPGGTDLTALYRATVGDYQVLQDGHGL